MQPTSFVDPIPDPFRRQCAIACSDAVISQVDPEKLQCYDLKEREIPFNNFQEVFTETVGSKPFSDVFEAENKKFKELINTLVKYIKTNKPKSSISVSCVAFAAFSFIAVFFLKAIVVSTLLAIAAIASYAFTNNSDNKSEDFTKKAEVHIKAVAAQRLKMAQILIGHIENNNEIAETAKRARILATIHFFSGLFSNDQAKLNVECHGHNDIMQEIDILKNHITSRFKR